MALPRASIRTPLLLLVKSARFALPSFSIAFCFVDQPNPWRSDTLRRARKVGTSSGTRWYEPPGFARRVANRARRILCDMPMLTVDDMR